MSEEETIDKVVDAEGAAPDEGEKAVVEEPGVEEEPVKTVEETEEKTEEVAEPKVLEAGEEKLQEEIPVDEEVDEEEEEKLTSESKESITTEDKQKESERRILEEYDTKEREESEYEYEKESFISDESEPFVRDYYIERYKELTVEKAQLLLKNNILQRNLNSYFKKKKITQVVDMDTTSEPLEIEKRYHELLIFYEKERNDNEFQENLLKEDLLKLKTIRNSKEKAYHEDFTAFQELEKSISVGLKYFSNGLRIPTELVDRAISRQLRKVNEAAAIRYKYIRCKNILSKTESKLEEVERLDEGLQVKDFEKLQVNNEAYMKKLEDRDAELKKQRKICAHYHEMIAHMKEEIDCEKEKCTEAEEEYAEVDRSYDMTRGQFGTAKKNLKIFNEKLAHEHTASGLLAYPKLHQDYKKTVKTITKLKEKQRELQEALKIHKEMVRKRSQMNTFSEQVEHRLRTKPRLHRSVNLGVSCCRC